MTSMTTATTITRSAHRTILQARPRLLGSLRLVPVALVLLGAASLPTPAGATSCHPGNVAVSGGTVTNQTTLDVSANGGVAVSNANGGNHNTASGGNGGAQGNGGNANAGNGGIAAADASGGMIDLDNINSGDNRGNTVAVSGGARCGGNLVVDGGTVRNDTTIALSANGGVAVSNANGGNHNTASGGNGGAQGNGGNANAGNGGIAAADASGGAVTIGDINSGNNSGNTVAVSGSTSGNVIIDGGTVSNETTIAISADGGTAVANAEGGNNNTATGGNGGAQGNGGDANAGNGGIAAADASGGSVSIGDVNSGGNSGNTIIVGP